VENLVGIIVVAIIIFIIFIAHKESDAKQKKIDALQEENDKFYDMEFKRRFKEIHGVDFNNAYDDPINKEKWNKWGEIAREGLIHWQPDFHSYIVDGLFSKNESTHYLDIMDDSEYEKFVSNRD